MSHQSPGRRRTEARARLAVATKPVPVPHEILDPHHKPDLRGEFAGARVQWRNGKQIVHLLPEQAKFYLDQGAIAPLLDS